MAGSGGFERSRIENPADLAPFTASVLQALANGELTAAEAADIMSVVAVHLQALQTSGLGVDVSELKRLFAEMQAEIQGIRVQTVGACIVTLARLASLRRDVDELKRGLGRMRVSASAMQFVGAADLVLGTRADFGRACSRTGTVLCIIRYGLLKSSTRPSSRERRLQRIGETHGAW